MAIDTIPLPPKQLHTHISIRKINEQAFPPKRKNKKWKIYVSYPKGVTLDSTGKTVSFWSMAISFPKQERSIQ